MANISINFTTNARQDARLAKILASVNTDRVAQNLDPFPDITAYFRFVITEAVKSYVSQQDNIDGAAVNSAYQSATDAIQGQVRNLLGL